MAGKNGTGQDIEVENTELQESSSKDPGQQPRRIPKCPRYGEKKDQLDEEKALTEQLSKLKMAEQAIEKANRIEQLKLAIAESQTRIMDLKQKRPLSSQQSKSSLAKTLPPTIP
ncbi:hypothetical protein ACROYT_G012359 [Oculina patagonica]